MNDPDTSASESTPAAEEAQGIVVNVFGRTDVGLVREHNEDNFLIADLTTANRSIKPEVRTHMIGPRGSLFVVCDGMGGAAAGEVASRIGVDTIYELMQAHGEPADDKELARWLEEAIREAGQRIFTAAKLNRGQRGMGTTVTAAVCRGPLLILGQVGDSRAHIIRAGELVQVTKDQSLVQQLIDAKQLTEEEAKSFDKSNIILQALGTTEEVHVDLTSVDLRRGDTLVMCSDGLSGMVDAETIRDAVVAHPEPMETCRRLTELACDHGGEDNITVIVARFDGRELLPPEVEDVVEYAKYSISQVTETTVRTPYPKDPNALVDEPDRPATEPEAAPEAPAEAATPASPAPAKEQADPQQKQPAPTASKDPAPPADDGPTAKKSKLGPVLGVLAAVVVAGGAAGYFAFGGSGDANQSAPGFHGAPAAVLPAPAPQAPVASPTAPAPEPPPLPPTDEEHIIGKGDTDRGTDDGGRRHGSAKRHGDGTGDAPAANDDERSGDRAGTASEDGSKGSDSPSKSTGEKKAQAGKKGGKKPAQPVIEDNPY